MPTPLAVSLKSFASELERLGIKPRAGAKSFGALEKNGAIAPSLRALWSWADGAKSPVFFDADSEDDDEGLTFLSVKQASTEMKVNLKHGLAPGLVPFASDLGGNSLCVDSASGRVVDWDHETRKSTRVAASLEAYLAASIKASKKRAVESEDAKPSLDAKGEVISKLLDHALAKDDPTCRKKAIAVMNDPRAQGAERQDDDWYLDQLIVMLMKAKKWTVLRVAAPFEARVTVLAAKHGATAEVAAALRG